MRKKRTSQKSALLEDCVDTLRLLNFNDFTYPEFCRLRELPERYVIRNYPHGSIYGTRGKKEALIVVHGLCLPFVPSDDGWTRIVIEAKWQEVSGSVDEKIPFVWASSRESHIPNWILLMDGHHWRAGRGKAVVQWAQRQSASEGRTWHAMNRRDFLLSAKEWWGGP